MTKTFWGEHNHFQYLMNSGELQSNKFTHKTILGGRG